MEGRPRHESLDSLGSDDEFTQIQNESEDKICNWLEAKYQSIKTMEDYNVWHKPALNAYFPNSTSNIPYDSDQMKALKAENVRLQVVVSESAQRQQKLEMEVLKSRENEQDARDMMKVIQEELVVLRVKVAEVEDKLQRSDMEKQQYLNTISKLDQENGNLASRLIQRQVTLANQVEENYTLKRDLETVKREYFQLQIAVDRARIRHLKKTLSLANEEGSETTELIDILQSELKQLSEKPQCSDADVDSDSNDDMVQKYLESVSDTDMNDYSKLPLTEQVDRLQKENTALKIALDEARIKLLHLHQDQMVARQLDQNLGNVSEEELLEDANESHA